MCQCFWVFPVIKLKCFFGSKTGESSCVSVLGIIAAGDCSINKAANQGNIIKVKSVDTKTISVLGLFTKKPLL